MKTIANNPKPTFCQHTGLAYIKDVPFTFEKIDELFEAFMAMHAALPKSAQFVFTPEIKVVDKINEGEVVLNFADVMNLQDLSSEKDVASEKDFNQ